MSESEIQDAEAKESAGRLRALVILGAAELLAMSLWFSASAVAPALQTEWTLSDSQTSWLTLAVQLGFVAGTLLSALLNLPDVISSRRLFTVAAIAGAGVNAAFGLFAHGFGFGITLRFLVGLALAGVYPPGMKWNKKRRISNDFTAGINCYLRAARR